MVKFDLSDRQQRTIGAAITLFSALFILFIGLAFFWLLGSFFATFSNVFMPLAVAAITALLLKPYYEWILRVYKGQKILATLTVYISIAIPFIAFLWFFGGLIIEQVTTLIARIPEWIKTLENRVKEVLPSGIVFWNQYEWGPKIQTFFQERADFVTQSLQTVGSTAMSAGTSLFRAIAGSLSWVVFPIYLTFFLMAKPYKEKQLDGLLPFLKTDTQRDVVYLVQEFVNILVAFFRGQFVICFLQGLLFAVGFMLIGLQYGFVLGLMLGFLNVIPYLGSILGLAIALPLAYFQTGDGLFILIRVIVVFVIVQMVEGYVLTPRVMGKKTGLHPLVIMVSIFFWGSALNGIAGMILAIPLTAFLVVSWRLIKTKYIKQVV